VAEGTLPDGLAIRGHNLLGTPRKTGTFRFAVRAANACAAEVRLLELVVTGKPILRAFPETLTVEYHIGQAAPAPLTVQVSSTWPNLPYAVETDAAWLTYRVRGGITPDPGSGFSSDVVSLEVNPKALAPGVYRASVRLATWQGANVPAVAVTLRVAP
jgi:hypothetical protein